MKLAFGKGLRVLLGVVIATVLHGCNDSANSASGNDAQLTVSLPHASSNRAARTAPEYIKTYTIEVRDAAENIIVPSREISASGGEVSLSVPPNTALRVIGAAFGAGGKEEGTARFRGDKVVPPIATGAKASVALILEASVPLSWPVQATGQGPLIAVANIKEVTVITTTAQPDQQVNFSITGGADLFSIVGIDFRSGQLSFNNPPSIGDYSVQVTFTDGFESVVQDLKVQVVARSGGLDLSFGTNGIVTTDFPVSTTVAYNDIAQAVVVQSDGKIIAAGTTGSGSNDFALARYNVNGTLDDTFGTQGRVIFGTINALETINAMALQPDGKIVVAGTISFGGDDDFMLARFNTDGSPDTSTDSSPDSSFGDRGNGSVVTDFTFGNCECFSQDTANALVIQADGKIVVVGSTTYLSAAGDFAMARYERNGALDKTFGLEANGAVITPITGATFNRATAVALQGDTIATSGKIVVAGYGKYSATEDDFVLVRYDNAGSLDATFNSTGVVATNFVPATGNVLASNDQARGMVVQPNRKIVVVGTSGLNTLAIVRYEENGSPDGTFGVVGNEGKVTQAKIDANAVILQPDGKIVVAGSYDRCNDACFDFVVARYNPDGGIDTAFGANGRVVSNRLRRAYALALQTDELQTGDNLIAAGFSGSDFAVVRYNP